MTVPEPGWKHATNAGAFREGGVFAWREHGHLWSGIVVEVDDRHLRVKVRDVLPATVMTTAVRRPE